MILRGFRRSWARNATLGAVVAGLVVLAACDKVPLTAPTESTISIFAAGSSVPANGSIDIVATVTESAGTAVQNGTVVTFTTTLGSITPAEARTNAGKVTVKLSADGRSGTASVVAFSGSAKSDPLEVPIGAAAADNIVLSASPSSVPASGGSVLLTAIVRDAAGNPLNGVTVTFSTTAGTLSQSSAVTNANGQATSTLTTTRDAEVTVNAGSKTATASVAVNPAPTLTVTVTPDAPVAGQPVTFTITVTPATNGSPVQSVQIDFGDGSSRNLGSSSTTASHVYAEDGTYTVTARATDTTGQQATQVMVIVVTPPPAFPVTLTVNTETPTPGVPVSFTASATANGSSIESYEWQFGDGRSATTSGPTTTHIYSTTGNFVVSVHVTAANGSEGDGQASVRVTAAP
jgi:PKD repeat protein